MHPKDSISAGQPEPPADAGADSGAEGEGTPEPVAAGKRRPRGRTTLIIAAAALLGIAGGVAVGYGVQAGRAPTPLTALSQPDLAYPAKALPAGQLPDPLPASQDRRVRTDGDLRKLIAPWPKGWEEEKLLSTLGWDGWLGVEDYALDFEDEDYMYGSLLDQGIRRVAGAAWKKGEYRTATVWLVQFRSGAAAADHAEAQRSYMPEADHGAGNDGTALKGSGNGRYYVFAADRKAGYMPVYQARAIFQRGDVMVDINVYDTAPISKKDIRTLAERQLERL
ncbi:hypothetical protein E6P78_29520 [Streptomyces sp. A0958]|uniref:hypothetical protein n=1 Tax=Streptomyces sp. A0958 TaxID=2563101 RepID=UPI00109E6429|nr:hypothetical protein [Streptomyces sp. A0958]THA59448.1 hypothetical protein E6P78_29520 [Streptomyces sp. A0958]